MWVGGVGKMLTFAYQVDGWVWQNTYVITRITKKDQMDLGESFRYLDTKTTDDKYLINFSHCNFLHLKH